MKQVAFVINPVATPHVARLKRRCHEEASARGWSPEFMGLEVDEGKDELERHLRAFALADEGPERLVFAVGGDGTVRACAHALAGTEAPLAVVARGTGNLFARAVGLPTRLDEAFAVGFEGRDCWVDLGEADGETFTAMAGIGIDAAVVGSTPRLFKDHLGWLGYALAALPQLNGPPHEMLVRIEGREPVTTRAQCVVVGNVGIMPGGFGIFPRARLDDGLLDVGVLYPKSVLGWALMARTVLSKGHFADRYFAAFQGAAVEVTAADELPRQLDGDAIAPSRNFAFSVRPRALRTRVPL